MQGEEEAEEEERNERAVSGEGYESDNDDTDAAIRARPHSSKQSTAAMIALAVAPDGWALPLKCLTGVRNVRHIQMHAELN